MELLKIKTMKNFKGLHEYGEGGITTEDFYPSNSATSSMIEESFGGDKKRKSSKTAQRNNKARPCLTCHKRN